MDNKYIHDLEDAFERMLEKTQTLEQEKLNAETLLKTKKEYLKNVIKYLVCKLEQSGEDPWEALQDISKLDRKKNFGLTESQTASLVTDYVCQKICA